MPPSFFFFFKQDYLSLPLSALIHVSLVIKTVSGSRAQAFLKMQNWFWDFITVYTAARNFLFALFPSSDVNKLRHHHLRIWAPDLKSCLRSEWDVKFSHSCRVPLKRKRLFIYLVLHTRLRPRCKFPLTPRLSRGCPQTTHTFYSP